ncbi:hypothetical protein H7I42_10570 [Mycolicibacterium vanbaalenii PYR-1]|uniref:PE-PGRS family protein n=1 Tax=Mycolicibacterium vanbaalenii (strain DSM 7251 / JCM 13017 / BCRC 16820 / KCTC 9966 / NRRL B-24157 / PYR-1) TaxID=350058 RepID=A1T8N0_MYCVP|nr:conserved hypothetical protein [Mycolicibacterium vanbaalenii PYR-1]MCV7127773.1 hypothetical protein [Mycolicibacterium vanbaalenii PYR-1]
MQLARRANPADHRWSALSTNPPRPTKLLGATVAIAGASVIAIGPVAPTLPAAQDRAVELSAWIDPIGVWGDTIATTVQNLGTQGAGLLTEGLPAAWEIITTSSLYSEIASAVFNPAPGLERFFGNLSTYAATIKTGLEESNAGTAEHYAKLPAALQTAWDFVLQGQFTKAFATITSWSIFGLGELGWPLEPVFKIPGEIARDFGLTAVGAVLDTLLVSDNATTGYAYSLLSPPITAIYQLTDILNVVSASIYDGDWVTAVSEVVNAPAKVLNAFLNGYQPSVAAEWEFFPGVFSKDGPIDALFVQLPKAIAAALAALSEDDEADETGETTTAETELPQVSSTALGAEADLVTVAVTTDTDEEDAAAAGEDGSTTVPTEPAPTDETAPADGETEDGETVTEPVDDGTDETTEAGAEEETEGSGDLAEDDTADTDTDNAGDPGAEDTPAGDTSDSGAGDTSDSGSGDTSDSDA